MRIFVVLKPIDVNLFYMTGKQQLNLYRITSSNVKLIAKRNGHQTDDLNTNQKIIQYIIDLVDGRRRPKLLDLKPSTIKYFKPFSIELYFCKIPITFQWQTFFNKELLEDSEINQDFLSFKTSSHASFLCFIYDDSDIFSFTGGLGNTYIKDFVDNDFGISILEKIATDESLEIRAALNSNITGNTVLDRRVYRGSQKTRDEDKTGKIYNEIVGNIPYNENLKNLKGLIFEGEENNRINVKAKSSLCFSKSIDLKELKDVINFLNAIQHKKSLIEFSQVRALNSRRAHEKVKIENNDFILCKILTESFKTLLKDTNYKNEDLLEISHSNVDLFYDCDEIKISRLGNSEIVILNSPYGLDTSEILKEILTKDKKFIKNQLDKLQSLKSDKNRNELIQNLGEKYFLNCFKENSDEPILSTRLKDCINCEIDDNGQPYFKMGKTWYVSNEDFLKDLNNNFKSILNASKAEFPCNLKWTKDDNENLFAEKILNENKMNTLVLHRIIPKNIQMELCDLIYWNEKEIFLIHIKPSFDGAVRVLEKQIVHASKIINEDLRNGLKATSNLHKYFELAKNYKGKEVYKNKVSKQLQKFNFEDFVKLFKNKKIFFTACIVDPNKARSITNIEEFRSSIAKLSILDTYKEIRKSSNPNSEFRIMQIENELPKITKKTRKK